MPPDDTLNLLRSGKLHGIHRLDLTADLASLPDEIYDLAETLEILNLSDNQLTDLPADLPRLHQLRVIFCAGNRFTRLPEILGQCPKLEVIGFRSNAIETLSAAALPPGLRWLILTDNRLGQLPPEIGHCKRLQKLMLAGNCLTGLPAEMRELKGLELLRLSANRFEALPDFIPTLPRLAWLAFGGNPFSRDGRESVERESIEWDRLDLHEQLGEGASGRIYRGTWHPEDSPSPRDVAVKLFKGGITSDGLPEDEIAASVAAGGHPSLISALGEITGHPDGSSGLVMPLAEDNFQALAGPPDLKTCTQDVYPKDRHFPFEVAVKIAADIASAAGHLHARGILHGDLYAHNILWNPQGSCLLGDFGAASMVPAHHAATLKKIEVRAFGHLLGELLSRIVPETRHEARVEELLALKDHCLCPDPQYRPDFQQIASFFSYL